MKKIRKIGKQLLSLLLVATVIATGVPERAEAATAFSDVEFDCNVKVFKHATVSEIFTLPLTKKGRYDGIPTLALEVPHSSHYYKSWIAPDQIQGSNNLTFKFQANGIEYEVEAVRQDVIDAEGNSDAISAFYVGASPLNTAFYGSDAIGFRLDYSDHTWDAGKVTKAATCTATGVKTYTCTECDKTKQETIAKNNTHTPSDNWIISKAATCTTDGSRFKQCVYCGAVTNTETIKATGHTWVLTGTTDSTCSKEGNKVYTCSTCDATKQEAITKKEHTASQTKTYLKKAATCTEDAEYWNECSVCHAQLGSSWKDVGTATGHTWSSEPTFQFSKDGKSCIAIYDCISGDSNTQVPCTVSAEVTKKPTCTEVGETTYTAEVEHPKTNEKSTEVKVIADVPALGHKFDVTTIAPTIREEGYDLNTCSVCGQVEKSNFTDKVTVDASTIAFDDTTLSAKESDDYKVLLQDMKFSVMGSDGKEYRMSIFDAGTDSTLISDGNITIHQVDSEGNETETVSKISDLEDGIAITGDSMYFTFETSLGDLITSQTYHKASKDTAVSKFMIFGQDAVTDGDSFLCELPCNASDVTASDFDVSGADGISVKSVTKRDDYWEVCVAAEDTDYTETYKIVIKKADHTYGKEVVSPTCTVGGYTEAVCTVCGNTIRSDETAALGHNYGKWIVDTYATRENVGKRHKECKRCGEVIEEVIPQITTEQRTEEGASFGTSTDDVLDNVLSPDEKERVKEGENATVDLEVTNGSEAPSATEDGYSGGATYDLNLRKQIGSEVATTVDTIVGSIPVVMMLPSELINTDPNVQREYKVIYVAADGTTKEVNCSFDATTGKLTYDCVGSGSYAVYYKDTILGVTDDSSALQLGAVYRVADIKYKVTSNATGKETVSVIGTTNKKLTKLSVKQTVTVAGMKCTVDAIGNNAFKNAKKLKSVTIGNGVKTVGKSAFAGCSGLTKVTLGKGVQKIESKAFYGCKKLKTLKISSTKLKKVGKSAIGKTSSNLRIKVPAKKLKQYKKLFKSNTGYKKSMKLQK